VIDNHWQSSRCQELACKS